MNEMEQLDGAVRRQQPSVATETSRSTFRGSRRMNPTVESLRMGARESDARGGRCRGDGGAVIVEFAIIVPIFFLLVFGIIDFGWAFHQDLDVRHGAREGSRLVAVNFRSTASPTAAAQSSEIVRATCLRMDDLGRNMTVTLTRSGTAAVGQQFTVAITKPLVPLTGFVNFALPSSINSSVKGRIEQTATWAAPHTEVCP